MSTPDEPPVTGSHYQPRLSVVLTLLVVFVAATVLVLRPSGPSSSTSLGTTTTTTTAPGTPVTTTTQRPSRSQVRVQVANGTLVTGLAHSYTQKLLVLGWDTLTEINAPSASRTLIYFKTGYQWAARTIANEIKAPSSSVVPLGHSTPVAGAQGDDVIVILGPDIAGG